jgi:small nuclear ribonucleoprotein (snRNP)-like protein
VNKVVARFQDGRTLKGRTNDFLPTKSAFHLQLEDAPPAAKPMEVSVAELKALFFVHDLDGDPDHKKINDFNPTKPVAGRKVRVEFADGEVLVGTTQGYQPDRPGFFLVPADARSNNERCFIVSKATKQVVML